MLPLITTESLFVTKLIFEPPTRYELFGPLKLMVLLDWLSVKLLPPASTIVPDENEAKVPVVLPPAEMILYEPPPPLNDAVNVPELNPKLTPLELLNTTVPLDCEAVPALIATPPAPPVPPAAPIILMLFEEDDKVMLEPPTK